MKSAIHSTAAVAMVLAAALGATTHAASPATTPTSPAPATPEAKRTYPSLLPLTLEVGADKANELRTLRDFTITAQREGDYAPLLVVGPVDPFTSTNACARPMPEGITGCVVNDDASVATLRVNWQVPDAGSYRVVLSGKRGTSDRVVTLGVFELETVD